ncbi:MAG: hypothetical protein ACR2OW_05150 [Methyloligellaceae bacterium]
MIRQCLAKILISVAMFIGAASANAETASFSLTSFTSEFAVSQARHSTGAAVFLVDPLLPECSHKKKPCKTCIRGNRTNLRKSMRGASGQIPRVLDSYRLSFFLDNESSDTLEFDPAFPVVLLSTMRFRI